MVNCCIVGCKSRSERNEPNITFHRFPIDPLIKNKWIDCTGRDNWQPSRHSRICSLHFEKRCVRHKFNPFESTAPTLQLKRHAAIHFTSEPTSGVIGMGAHYVGSRLRKCNHNEPTSWVTGTEWVNRTHLNPRTLPTRLIQGSQKEEDEMDEGQEEWLSEDTLTDDDYNNAGDQMKADSNLNTSQDTAPSLHESDLNEDTKDAMSIEETLDNFQNTNQTELPEELGAFLIRKTDGKVVDAKREESEIDESTKQSDDDGHDTDELLRMLGGEDNSMKDGVKKLDQKRTHETQSSDEDDDEYIFEGAKVARLKIAKNAILKKYPSKAVPEETSDRDTDMSSDEGLTVKRMFGVTRKGNVASKSTAKSSLNALKTVTKKAVSLQKPGDKNPVTSTPIPKPVTQTKVVRAEPEEIIDEEEFLEEDQFDLDEELEMEAELQQRIMRPEQMDEEVPSDADSHEDDDSLYDELPSSDSDDLNEWFTIDIRSERAGEYIPLLGGKAHQLLQAEKQRVSSRLNTLKQSVSALNKSSAQQAEMLRRATLQLAELDAALKA